MGKVSSLYFLPLILPQVITKVDIVYEKDMLYLYVLSGIGGLLLLLLIFLVLYKVGLEGVAIAEMGRLGKRDWQESGRRMPRPGNVKA